MTTEIQSGPGAFDEWRLVMTFLTNLEVTEMLCSLRLVPDGKAGIAIPESRFNFSEKFSANNFAL